MKILLLAHTYYGSPFKVGSHFLFEEYGFSNHEVSHISTPITPFHRMLRVFNRDKSKVHSARFASADAVVGNVIPTTFIPIQMRLSALFIPKKFRAQLSQKVDLILIDQVHFLKYTRFFDPEAQVVLRLTDFVSKKREIEIIRRGNFSKVIVTNKHILKNLNISDVPSIVIPNGFPCVAENPTNPAINRHGMIYVGSLDSRIDWTIVQKIAAHPKFEFIHIYGLPKPKAALPDRVSYLGLIPHRDSLKLYTKFKFGILPYEFSPQNICRSPMKLYEYIACGLIVLVPDFLKSDQYSENRSVATFESWIQNNLDNGDCSNRSITKDVLGSTWEVLAQKVLLFCLQGNTEMSEGAP
jgi:teichuronic acid biosynthesis glycosyltransferase TuaH